MKTTRESAFTPVTIVLETKEEVAVMRALLWADVSAPAASKVRAILSIDDSKVEVVQLKMYDESVDCLAAALLNP
jgi:hypothetical protein